MNAKDPPTIPSLALVGSNVKAISLVGDYVSRLPFLYGMELLPQYSDDFFGASDPGHYLDTIKGLGYNTIIVPIYLDLAFPTSPVEYNATYVDKLSMTIHLITKHGLNAILSFAQRHLSRRLGGYGLPDWCLPEDVLAYFRPRVQEASTTASVSGQVRYTNKSTHIAKSSYESRANENKTQKKDIQHQRVGIAAGIGSSDPGPDTMDENAITRTTSESGPSGRQLNAMSMDTYNSLQEEKSLENPRTSRSCKCVRCRKGRNKPGIKTKYYNSGLFNADIISVLTPIIGECREAIAGSASSRLDTTSIVPAALQREGQVADAESNKDDGVMKPLTISRLHMSGTALEKENGIYFNVKEITECEFAEHAVTRLMSFVKQCREGRSLNLRYGQFPMPGIGHPWPKRLVNTMRSLESRCLNYLKTDKKVLGSLCGAVRFLCSKLSRGALGIVPPSRFGTFPIGDDGYTDEYDAGQTAQYMYDLLQMRFVQNSDSKLLNVYEMLTTAAFEGSDDDDDRSVMFRFNNYISSFAEAEKGLTISKDKNDNGEHDVKEPKSGSKVGIESEVTESTARILRDVITIRRPLIFTPLKAWKRCLADSTTRRYLVHVSSLMLPSSATVSSLCEGVSLYAMAADIHCNARRGISPCTPFMKHVSRSPVGWICGCANPSLLIGSSAVTSGYYDIQEGTGERMVDRKGTLPLTPFTIITKYPSHHFVTEMYHSGAVILTGAHKMGGLFIPNFESIEEKKESKMKKKGKDSSDAKDIPAPHETLAIACFKGASSATLEQMVLSKAALVQTHGPEALGGSLSVSVIGSTTDNSVMEAIKRARGCSGVFASGSTDIGVIASLRGDGIPVKLSFAGVKTITVKDGKIHKGIKDADLTGAVFFDCEFKL